MKKNSQQSMPSRMLNCAIFVLGGSGMLLVISFFPNSPLEQGIAGIALLAVAVILHTFQKE